MLKISLLVIFLFLGCKSRNTNNYGNEYCDCLLNEHKNKISSPDVLRKAIKKCMHKMSLKNDLFLKYWYMAHYEQEKYDLIYNDTIFNLANDEKYHRFIGSYYHSIDSICGCKNIIH